MNNRKERKVFEHLLHYQKIYLILLLLLIASAALLSNYFHQKPLLMGGESYYYLSLAREELPYHSLTLLLRAVPESAAFLLPPLLSLSIILLFYPLARKQTLSDTKTFFIVLFYILTPAFIFSSVTISSYSLFLLLILLGANLLLLQTKTRYLSIIPFLLASWIDIFSSLLLLAGLATFFFLITKTKERFPTTILLGIAAVTIVNATLLGAPFFIGPFTVQDKAADLISDLGSFSGLGVFTVLVAVVGIVTGWHKKAIPVLLPALAIFTTAYLLNTHTIFFLSLLVIVLAGFGLANLAEQQWKLPFIRNVVLLLLLLGVFFSAVAYLDRLSEYPPTAVDQKSLGWIQRNTVKDAVILSAPENSYYISYFAQRKPVFSLHRDYAEDHRLSKEIFSAFYIDELFPLLEKNKVSIIYVSEEMKKELPAQQEFLFLLQNERFKLLYFTEDAEVWSFEVNDDNNLS